MRRIDFNRDWTCKCLTRDEPPRRVTLPHDAMISEPRREDSVAEGNVGWYIGGDYAYEKRFEAPEAWRGHAALLEFEGVSRDCEVFINGQRVGGRPYAYTNFYVDAAPYLKYGQQNELRVVARNTEQPNSRWYPGTGLYRPVWLHLAGAAHIPVNGLRVRTVHIAPAEVEVIVLTTAPGPVKVEILREGRVAARAEGQAVKREPYQPVPATFGCSAQAPSPAQLSSHAAVMTLQVPDAALWSCDAPNLYTCRASFAEDVAEETFGIRELKWTPDAGMTINGQRVILRGACVHHDNGPLGACAFPEAEARKVRLMKANGYNALRSAHNPCSKAMLDACDRLGVLMMDEYVDVWYIHKTKYDYALHLKDWWQDDLREMVEKDYNHPCVVMYSTGNEVAETSEPKGIAFTGEMTRYLHGLDPTRPVTCGINIFFNFLYSIGFGVYSDDKADKQQKAAEKPAQQKKKKVGSEFYNTMAAKAGDTFMKFGATLHGSDVKTRDAYANMDIAGYNYGIFRYRKDLKKYPNRLILGSETFCKDAYSFWEIARDNPRIIGDFVWAGMEYIGECGLGGAEYEDYKVGLPMYGGGGRVDVCGFPKAEAAYTRVALEREAGPCIAVWPVYQKGKLQITGWQLTKALESWAWAGCDGAQALVEVFARAAEVELRINGKSVGRRRVKKARASFKTTYQSGTVEAVAYDADGREIGRKRLVTAGEETRLNLLPERDAVPPEGLAYIPIRYTDGKGVWKPMEKHLVTLSVENGALAGVANGCCYFKGNYTDDHVQTYYGEALAVVRAGTSGTVKVTASDGERTQTATIIVKERQI